MKTNYRSDVALLVCLVTSLSLVACSKSPGAGRLGNAASTEMFERPYIYLLKNDPGFGLKAQNFSFMPAPVKMDSVLTVETKSEREHNSNPGSDFREDFTLHVARQMTLDVTFADSTGTGFIFYEFLNLPPGDYTMGSKGWPVAQRDLSAGRTTAYVFFVSERKLRARYLLGLDAKSSPTYHPPKGQSS